GARGGDPPGRFDAGESYVVFGRRSGEPALTLVVNPDSVAEDGAPATATLTRNTDIGTALTVALASSDVGEATVPRAVEIPIGQRSVTFDVTPRTDGLVDGDQTATIAASATGFAEVSADVEVTDVDGLAPTAIGEWGQVRAGAGPVTVHLSRSYVEPVVFLSPPSFDD
ncbi:MAG: hypothetical protein AAFZ07_30290, partial [Actinomycetota bacterium]